MQTYAVLPYNHLGVSMQARTRSPPPGDDPMQMRIVGDCRAPGGQDQAHADACAQVTGMGSAFSGATVSEDDTVVVVNNPAAVTRFERTTRVFANESEFSPSCGGAVRISPEVRTQRWVSRGVTWTVRCDCTGAKFGPDASCRVS